MTAAETTLARYRYWRQQIVEILRLNEEGDYSAADVVQYIDELGDPE